MGPYRTTHSCEASLAVWVWRVTVDVFEELLIVFHDLLIDVYEWICHLWLIFCPVGEDDWFVLAEPRGRDVDGGLDGHVSSLLVVLRMDEHPSGANLMQFGLLAEKLVGARSRYALYVTETGSY